MRVEPIHQASFESIRIHDITRHDESTPWTGGRHCSTPLTGSLRRSGIDATVSWSAPDYLSSTESGGAVAAAPRERWT